MPKLTVILRISVALVNVAGQRLVLDLRKIEGARLNYSLSTSRLARIFEAVRTFSFSPRNTDSDRDDQATRSSESVRVEENGRSSPPWYEMNVMGRGSV